MEEFMRQFVSDPEILKWISDPAVLSGAAAVVGALVLISIYNYIRKASELHKPTHPTPDTVEATAPKEELAQPDLAPAEVEKPAPRKELKDALSGTKANLFGRMKERFAGGTLGSDDIENLEEILYTSDLGPQTVQRLVETVGDVLKTSEKSDITKVQAAIKSEMSRIFADIHSDVDNHSIVTSLDLSDSQGPQVLMVVGVNGAGKTTTIGKLAYQLTEAGKKVLLVAGDTFRAAAEEQLEVWSSRAKVEIYSPANVKDPSAVAFEGLSKAKAENFDVVIVDTAGRLHTQENLMEELKKMKRVMKKIIPEAPHQTFIVLDANSGQNALMQAKSFNEALGLTGAVLTKLDGSAKGGVAVGLAYELALPIRLIGVGEGIEDLRPFEPQEFVDSII